MVTTGEKSNFKISFAKTKLLLLLLFIIYSSLLKIKKIQKLNVSHKVWVVLLYTINALIHKSQPTTEIEKQEWKKF